MKKRLNENILQLGDIALTTSKAFESKAIRTVTRSDISHAMLYVTHGSIIHAIGDGVRAENIRRFVFDEDTAVHVLRIKGGLPLHVAQQIVDYSRKLVGTKYSRFEAARSVLVGRKTFSEMQFCSRLVAQAYSKHGYELVPNPNYCTPGALLKSKALEHVADATRLLSDEEALHALKAGEWLDDEATALNFVLNELRIYDKSIQKFSDIGRFAKATPEKDRLAAELLMESGYLNFWQEWLREGAWQFDIKLMNEDKDNESVRAYCIDTVEKGEPRDSNRFSKSLRGLRADHQHCPCRTFELLIELYSKLVNLHACRFDVASTWLAKQAKASNLPT